MDHRSFKTPAQIFVDLAAGNPQRRMAFDPAQRRAALQALSRAIHDYEAEILAALAEDFSKPEAEIRLSEILPVQAEISHALRHLKTWTKVRRVRPTRAMLGTRARIVPEPKGTALIIAPWNYPLALSLGPLVSAIAAGCAAIVKPSELAPASAAVIAQIVEEALPADLVRVVQGGVEVSQELLDQPFDHIFFTGSPRVGKIVMAAAAKHLTSVTLELGGKSPVIVGPGADLKKAARMIAWGKFANAGQTCIAPDHVYVAKQIEAPFLAELKAAIARMYGKTEEAQAASRDLARIINPDHFTRLMGMIESAQSAGAKALTGATSEAESRYIAPTVLMGTDPSMRVEQEEIFGPVLPVIPFDDAADVVARIEAGPKPLALYIFERDRGLIDRLRRATSSGAVGVNVALVHYLHQNLPFGGIGNSGVGAAHGHWGFEAFTHLKPVLENRFAPLAMLMPPYRSGRMAKLAQKFLR
ncbi:MULTISPECIES: aldehyde dehydrogenase family protein [Thioclava]|uniref:aldehyde dehydrogenase family protein n=1 Tax=Thioclava TaxID=285107 RepID=UPI000C3CD8D7|nr:MULTISPECIES: aldehyde dehydrogenase family protein [Thioclava]MAQ37646.1 aldehyde dehydrogenase [Thioclava sp.]